jgi:hypothetical protein
MVGPTRGSSNGFRATGSSDLPPPPPMTPSEAFMATQTEVLRQILQTQQPIAQQMNRGRHMGPITRGLIRSPHTLSSSG